MLTPEASLRLSILRFPLIVGVVFIHAYKTSVGLADGVVGTAQNHYLADFIRNLISQEIARTAVPLFFLMSGYLFFSGRGFTARQYLTKLKARSRSLLVPFLFWNVSVLLLFAVFQALPATRIYFSGNNALIEDFDAVDHVNAILGIGRLPIAYQFWFIRDLMILVLTTPILYFFLKDKKALLLLLPFFVLWFLGISPVSRASSEAIPFFTLGCYLSIQNKDLFALDAHGKQIAFIYMLVALASAALMAHPLHPYLHNLGVLLGVPTMLFLTKRLAQTRSLGASLVLLGSTSFFVYAAHEPALGIVRKLAYKCLQPEAPALVLTLYFVIPAAIILALVIGHKALSRALPTFTSLVTGGR